MMPARSLAVEKQGFRLPAPGEMPHRRVHRSSLVAATTNIGAGRHRVGLALIAEQPVRRTGRVSRPALISLVAICLVAVAAWLQWRARVDPLHASGLPFAAAGRAETIDDGDTFVFVSADATAAVRRVRVRLHAVDTPELVQSYGLAARSALADLTRSAVVTIDCYKRDAHGRAVCRVRSHDAAGAARDVEQALIERGLAWHYRAFAAEQTAAERARYAAAESEARAERRGLWQQATPMPPWSCRDRLRVAAACD